MKRFIIKLKEGKYLWLFIAIILAISILWIRGCFIAYPNLSSVVGAALELFGSAIVFISIDQKLEVFGRKKMIPSVIEYFKSLFVIRNHELTFENAGIKIKVGSAMLSIQRTPEHSFEDIIKYINEQRDQLRKEIEFERKNRIEDMQEQSELFNKKLMKIEKEHVELRNKVHKSVTPNPFFDLLGIGCIILGILLSAF